jgi:hypothetical protein
LKLADALHNQPKPVPARALAAQLTDCGSVSDSTSPLSCDSVALRLTRLLRACAAYGVFREEGDNTWLNTPMSDYLRVDHPDSLRDVVLNFGGVQYKMMAELPTTIRTGEASFSRVFNEEFWAWHKLHPAEHSIFDATMNQLGRLGGADVAIGNDYPFADRVGIVVDVGGGFGELLYQILAANPKLKQGIIFDMPHVIARSDTVWKGRIADQKSVAPSVAAAASRLDLTSAQGKEIAEKVELVGGDMFDSSTIPSIINVLKRSYDVEKKAKTTETLNEKTEVERCTHSSSPGYGYVLRDILHDWNDEDSIRILAALRAVMRGNETTCYSATGTVTTRPAPAAQSYKDRVLIVARIIKPKASFIGSLGTNDADMVMLGGFGTSAGERTEEHFSRLFSAAGLQLVSVTPTRSHYFVIEGRVA